MERLTAPVEEDVLPASVAQEGLWTLAQIEPGNDAYHLAVGFRLKGPLRLSTLEQSLRAIIDRHESLRTTFELHETQLRQIVRSTSTVELVYQDLSARSDAEIDTVAYSQARAEFARPFDLSRGPLIRAKLLKVRSEDHILICTMHHIISDRWSTQVFACELAGNYDALLKDAHYRPEPLPFQYSDYTFWQRDFLQTETFQRQIAYWKQKLAGAPPVLDLPSDRPRPAKRVFEGSSQSAPLPLDLVERCRTFAANHGATFFMMMLGVLAVLLYRYTGQTDILIGVPVAGRNHVETESLIGLFANTIVARTDLSGNPRFTAVLAQVRATLLDALENQDVPFEKLIEELRPVRSSSYSPIFQVSCTSFRAPVEATVFGEMTGNPYLVNPATSRFDLSVSVIEGTHGRCWLEMDYNTGLFDHDRMARMLGHYEQLLQSVTHASL